VATNILVVDDSDMERVLAKGLLCKNPEYRVVEATDGDMALEKMAADPPDMVVTDMVMPEMDGLELVRTVRQRHPNIPVILMTAYGDESTAVEALDAGAASYVPKVRRAERLVAAVDRVAENAKVEHNRRRLEHSLLNYQARFALENDARLLRALVGQVQQVMAGLEFLDAVERIRIGEALEEAMLNAMYHGNLEIGQKELDEVRGQLDDELLARMVEERCGDPRFCDRKILVVIHLTKTQARFVVRDQGRGFRQTFPADASDRFESGGFRGMTLIHSLMDEVTYNESGNELVLLKRQRALHATGE